MAPLGQRTEREKRAHARSARDLGKFYSPNPKTIFSFFVKADTKSLYLGSKKIFAPAAGDAVAPDWKGP